MTIDGTKDMASEENIKKSFFVIEKELMLLRTKMHVLLAGTTATASAEKECKKLYTFAEAGKYMGCSQAHIYKSYRQGLLIPTVVELAGGGTRMLFTEEELGKIEIKRPNAFGTKRPRGKKTE